MSVRTLNKTIDNYDGSSDEDIDSTEEAEIRELLGSAPQFDTRTEIHADLFGSAPQFAPRTANVNSDIAFPPSEILHTTCFRGLQLKQFFCLIYR